MTFLAFKARRPNNVNFYQSLVSKDLLLETITSSSFNVQSPEIAKQIRLQSKAFLLRNLASLTSRSHEFPLMK